jgi:hypothetical protein
MNTEEPAPAPLFDWRAHIGIHHACELFPLMPLFELDKLAADIQAQGLLEPITLWKAKDEDKPLLLDGRNRFAAMAFARRLDVDDNGQLCDAESRTPIKVRLLVGGDPYAIALSLNIHRRHLTGEQKRDLIAKVLELQSEKSNRQIARITETDDKTVATVRAEKEARAEIPHVDVITDTKGRRQPARKSKSKPPEEEPPVADPAASAEQRKAWHNEHDDTASATAKPTSGNGADPTKGESLAAIIQLEWREAEAAVENLTRHAVSQIADSIPHDDRKKVANRATEYVNLFQDLAAKLLCSVTSHS